jgi:hypothetical protein
MWLLRRGQIAGRGALDATSTPTYTGPGDVQSFLAWGSVARGYSAAYAALGASANAIDIVDTSGGNAATINILSTGLIDVATLNTWIGLHGTACVAKLYDQSGNTRHWTQATTSKMPRITMNTLNSLPVMTFASTSSQTMTSASISSTAEPYTFLSVGRRTANFSSKQATLANGPGSGAFAHWADFADAFRIGLAGDLTDTSVADSAAHVMQGCLNGLSNSTLNVDGNAQIGPGSTGAAANLSGTTSIGSYQDVAFYMDGYLAEVGIYAATYNATLQSNTRTAYGL